MSPSNYGTLFKKAAKRAGVEKFSPKMLRDTKAYWMRKNGVTAETARDVLGHASVTTTIDRYQQIDEQDQMLEYLNFVTDDLEISEYQDPEEFM